MQKRILLVVGDRDTRELLAQGLSDQGFGTVAAADGISGLFQLGMVQPDLVVLDDTDWEILRRIRAVSGVPVIALVEDDSKSKVASLNHGADYFVLKPPSLQELDAKARVLFRSRSAPLSGAMPLE